MLSNSDFQSLIPTFKGVMDLLDAFKQLPNVQQLKEYSEFAEIQLRFIELCELKKQPSKGSRNELEKISQLLHKRLTNLSTNTNFSKIQLNNISIQDVLYDAALVLADMCPINPHDPYTLDDIAQQNKVVTFDRYQFDVSSLYEMLRRVTLESLTNPLTRNKFSERDRQSIQKHINAYIQREGLEPPQPMLNSIFSNLRSYEEIYDTVVNMDDTTVRELLHADNIFVMSLAILRMYNLLSPSNISKLALGISLVEQPASITHLLESDGSYNYYYALTALAASNILSQENYDLLTMEVSFSLEMLAGIDVMHEAGILTQENFDIVISEWQLPYTGEMLVSLYDAGILIQANLTTLFQFRNNLSEMYSYFFSYTAEAVKHMQKAGLLTQINFNILMGNCSHRHFRHLIDCIRKLSKAGILTQDNFTTMIQNLHCINLIEWHVGDRLYGRNITVQQNDFDNIINFITSRNPLKNVQFNSFSMVRYEGLFPDSRSMHTSFFEKVWDTFRVWRGSHVFFGATNPVKHDSAKSIRGSIDIYLAVLPEIELGLFDYLTFGLFRLIQFLASVTTEFVFTPPSQYKNPVEKLLPKIFINAARLLALPLMLSSWIANIICNGIIRPVVGAVLTLTFLPVIFISHVISKLVQSYKGEQLAKTHMIGTGSGSSMHSLRKALGKHSLVRSTIKQVDHQGTVELGTGYVGNYRSPHFASYQAPVVTLFPPNSVDRNKLIEVNPSARELFLGSYALNRKRLNSGI